MSTAAPIDTSDMVAVHDVFRRALASAPDFVGSVARGDDDRVAVVASFYANVLAFLHVHYESQDLLLWPLLLERVADADLVSDIAAQHPDVDSAVAGAEARLGEWAARPAAETAKALAYALSGLGDILARHFADEEREILPLAAQHLSEQEWAQFAAHGLRVFTGDKSWLVLGLVQTEMTPEQVQAMLARMPPPAVDFWLGVGKPQYEAFMATLRG